MSPEHVHNRENVFPHRENRRWRELSLYALTSRANLAHLGKQEGWFTNGHGSIHWLCQQRWDQTCFSFHCQFRLLFLSDMWRKKVCLCALSSDSDTAKKSLCVFHCGCLQHKLKKVPLVIQLAFVPLLSRRQAELGELRQDSVPGWLRHNLFSDFFLPCCNWSFALTAALCL